MDHRFFPIVDGNCFRPPHQRESALANRLVVVTPPRLPCVQVKFPAHATLCAGTIGVTSPSERQTHVQMPTAKKSFPEVAYGLDSLFQAKTLTGIFNWSEYRRGQRVRLRAHSYLLSKRPSWCAGRIERSRSGIYTTLVYYFSDIGPGSGASNAGFSGGSDRYG